MNTQDIKTKNWKGKWSTLGENLLHTDWLNRHDMTLNDYNSIDRILQPVLKEGLKILEIGSGRGSSTAMLAIYALRNKGRVFTCDPLEEIVDYFHQNLGSLDLLKHVEFKPEASTEFVPKFEDESFDFIFVDGDHSYQPALDDFKLCYPKLKQGGVICGHDCEAVIQPDGIFNVKLFSKMRNFQWPGTILSYRDQIDIDNSGRGNIKDIIEWDIIDIVGFRPSQCGEDDRHDIGIHPGCVMAVAEFFKGKAKLEGDRIWWYRKQIEK